MLWLSKHGATAAVEPRAATQEGSLDHIINHAAPCDRTRSIYVCVGVRQREIVFQLALLSASYGGCARVCL